MIMWCESPPVPVSRPFRGHAGPVLPDPGDLDVAGVGPTQGPGLQTIRTAASSPLVLSVEQTKNVNWFRNPAGVEVRQILLGQLASFRFTHGRDDEEYETWDRAKIRALPDWIRVYLTQKRREPLVWFIYRHVSDSRNDPKVH